MKKDRIVPKVAVWIISAALLFLAAMPAGAADAPTADEWKFTADLYGFLAGIGGKTGSGDDIDIPFDKILDNLDMTFMGGLGASKGKWSFAVDIVYMDLSADNKSDFTLPIGHEGLTVSTSASVDLKSWIVTPTIGYQLIDAERGSLNLIAGVRYFSMDIDFNLKATGPFTTRKFKLSASPDVWDGIVGVKGQLNLGSSWFLPCYADVGGGDSQLTWQVFGGVGYRFQHLDLVAGYRYLAYEFDPNPAVDKLNISGPLVGLRFHF